MAENAQRIVLGPIVQEGDIFGGAQLWHYEAGTNTVKAIWEDRGKEIELPQPLTADANAYFSFFADGLYKVIITTPEANSPDEGVIYAWDNYAFVDATDSTIERGDAVNSASTVPIGPGYWQHILGSVPIAAFSGVLSFFWGVFDGNPTLTHSSNLILPGTRNRSMKTGDVGFFLNEGSGAWRMAAHMESEGGYQGRQGSAYAATTTLPVPTDGDFVDIGGSDLDIAAIVTMAAGYKFTARFTGSGCQLVHNATSLICPFGLDYRLVTNELVDFRSLGTGNWMVAFRSGSTVPPATLLPVFYEGVDDGFLLPTGTALVASRYRSLAKRCIPAAAHLGTTGTSLGIATFDNATDTWTRIGHTLVNGDLVQLTNGGGGLPSGFSVATVYFVINGTADTFKLSLTYGGTAVNGTTNGTGIQTVHNKFQLPDLRGRYLVPLDNLGGTNANVITSASIEGANASALGDTFGRQTSALGVGFLTGAGAEWSNSTTPPSTAVGVQMRW